MPDYILGTGLDYPYRMRRGMLTTAAAVASVEAAMRMLFDTAIGQRFMLPQYGSNLHELLFEPCDSVTAARAEVYVGEAIVRWIPRIKRVRTSAEADPLEHLIRIQVEYSLINDPTERTFVYPFYLRRQ